MGIVLKPAEQSPAGGELFVAFENTSQSDFVLNLGIMLANGKVMLPTGIRLSLTASDSATREFVFSDRRYGAIAGRVDDFVVSLRAGSTYTLRLTLDQFIDPAQGRLALPLAAGNHRILARFESHPPRTGNLDMQGVALLNFWKGTVQSNVVEFESRR